MLLFVSNRLRFRAEALCPMTIRHGEGPCDPLALSGLFKHLSLELLDCKLHLAEVPVALQKISQLLASFNQNKSLCRLAYITYHI